MNNVEKKIKKIISKILNIKVEKILNNASFLDDLSADSLDIVELIMAIEEEFDIEISDEDAEKLNTVQKSIDYINNKNKK
ncbi:acyl carrier protein [Buchnera aphidicola]|uniref:Acyl carrier protein n=1 Tax=Buchnera aphidicola subsp. Schizaphis graminum (strain Sg) TaxID=198804 RepID=ACP_BUCAP|nr:acyl carrier protein [Buchnera aphidicola]Q8K9J4.1 RecName: Full=Acyl carrier protein; Short=ACP [Buchnera aphidicola str. Sg (Schizaphis graminum)]AAM67894.1 acyl-carrier protein [Buchnera aphidicola str. Sg (Schizaphis graminum)]AWI49963.1 acyl carrier protein [Buchnera aphidicola (Schizaphis graminum)]